MKKIKKTYLIILIIFIFAIGSVNAIDSDSSLNKIDLTSTELNQKNNSVEEVASFDLESEINDAEDGDEILIEPGTYKIHDMLITKSITLQGNGNPRDIIIDGEQKSSIFLIRNDEVHVTFKNITFINANIIGFGGAISMEIGHVYVDNCIFANNTASVNAGGISNYGNENTRGYLLVNNSLFINNHGDHDGGAITTCYADSYIYNTVFINNSAHRDGGAIRVSVAGYGNVEDCIFMFNHADEWGGAYYSWSGTSDINRCIFLNNTAGTNGGAVMVSGDLNLENSIIMNNNGGETGGSFYIQQPMYDAPTKINVHNNLITNNTSPYGKEIFIKWNDTKHLFTKFDDNDWGDEDPNDPSVIDPDKVTSRSKVTSTIKSNLLNILNLGLLTKYADLLDPYFPEDYLDNIKNGLNNTNENEKNKKEPKTVSSKNLEKFNGDLTSKNPLKSDADSRKINTATSNINSPQVSEATSNSQFAIGNSTTHGENDNAYEINEHESVAKQSSVDYKMFIAILSLALILLAIGYRREKKMSK